ncbi:hypothetical protein L198_02586 [Cryptococcus wingfieldii CBS 7118]|uniref:Uncharacterized protein n=1 Tax=Cryptococcus wingfieldii CBS 7118 TaxID=1295528 RepID=A0A1E3JLV4_9TREE|nr:hypothetical protein L198_02586 [Cryptococcus wingfieldii CBS 7118]ODO01859.1 hypothetical protein L198_02586 [Cryptococcus wingfieldii CBS 7118]
MAPTTPKGKGKAPVAVHDESKSIRAQSKKDKPKQDSADKSALSKDVQKAVLANPLTVPWPNMPKYLQDNVLHLLNELVPSHVADYHVLRARCQQSDKRRRRAQEHKAKNPPKDEDATMSEPESEPAETGQKRKRPTASAKTATTSGPPEKPEILSHLVMGINEVIKGLETQIDNLKLQLLVMGDTLNGNQPGKPGKPDLLPTAPRSPSPSSEGDVEDLSDPAPATKEKSPPITFIIVPLLSINPQSLVSPIPSYCATYNALAYQHAQLSKILQTRLKKEKWAEVMGEEREEVRVVPLGAVEKEMAEIVGLRRLACLGIRESHPDVSRLQELLPKAKLPPPRHSVTLPFPTSSLTVHTGRQSSSNSPNSAISNPQNLPPVTYAALHIKGIQTKQPADGNSRKAKRLQEVRGKREEAKVRKVEAKKAGKGKGSKGEKNGKGKKWTAAQVEKTA